MSQAHDLRHSGRMTRAGSDRLVAVRVVALAFLPEERCGVIRNVAMDAGSRDWLSENTAF